MVKILIFKMPLGGELLWVLLTALQRPSTAAETPEHDDDDEKEHATAESATTTKHSSSSSRRASETTSRASSSTEHTHSVESTNSIKTAPSAEHSAPQHADGVALSTSITVVLATPTPTPTPTSSGVDVDTASPSFRFESTTNFFATSSTSVRSTASSSSTSSSHTPIGRGGVAGVTVAGFAVVVLAVASAWWWLARRKAKREEPKAYPELAYLYTPSPAPTGSTPGSYGQQEIDYENGYSSPPPAHYTTAYNPAFGGYAHNARVVNPNEMEMREMLVRDDNAPVAQTHQWRGY